MSVSTNTDERDVSRRKTGQILAERRVAVKQSDDYITNYDKINQDGRKMGIRKKQHKDPEVYTAVKVEFDLTTLLAPGASTSSNVELLFLEAKIADENEDYDGNPHVPTRDSVYDEAVEKIEAAGLVPAWEVASDG